MFGVIFFLFLISYQFLILDFHATICCLSFYATRNRLKEKKSSSRGEKQNVCVNVNSYKILDFEAQLKQSVNSIFDSSCRHHPLSISFRLLIFANSYNMNTFFFPEQNWQKSLEYVGRMCLL